MALNRKPYGRLYTRIVHQYLASSLDADWPSELASLAALFDVDPVNDAAGGDENGSAPAADEEPDSDEAGESTSVGDETDCVSALVRDDDEEGAGRLQRRMRVQFADDDRKAVAAVGE